MDIINISTLLHLLMPMIGLGVIFWAWKLIKGLGTKVIVLVFACGVLPNIDTIIEYWPQISAFMSEMSYFIMSFFRS